MSSVAFQTPLDLDTLVAQIIADEGWGKPKRPGFIYKDSAGLDTIGAGHLWTKETPSRFKQLFGMTDEDIEAIQAGQTALTPDQMELLLKDHDLPKRLGVARDLFYDFDTYPESAQQAIANMVFRGGLKSTHKTADHIRNRDWEAAAKEYLDNDEYRASKALNEAGKEHGVQGRMERNRDRLLAGVVPQEEGYPSPAFFDVEDPASFSMLPRAVQRRIVQLEREKLDALASSAIGSSPKAVSPARKYDVEIERLRSQESPHYYPSTDYTSGEWAGTGGMALYNSARFLKGMLDPYGEDPSTPQFGLTPSDFGRIQDSLRPPKPEGGEDFLRGLATIPYALVAPGAVPPEDLQQVRSLVQNLGVDFLPWILAGWGGELGSMYAGHPNYDYDLLDSAVETYKEDWGEYADPELLAQADLMATEGPTDFFTWNPLDYSAIYGPIIPSLALGVGLKRSGLWDVGKLAASGAYRAFKDFVKRRGWQKDPTNALEPPTIDLDKLGSQGLGPKN